MKFQEKKLEILFKSITDKVIWMSIESAEMTKHAINSFLANSVIFVNEISAICEKVGADAHQREVGAQCEGIVTEACSVIAAEPRGK